MKSDVGKESYKRHCLAAQGYFQGMFDRLEAQGRSRGKGWAMVLRSFLDEKQALGKGLPCPTRILKRVHARAGSPMRRQCLQDFHGYLCSSWVSIATCFHHWRCPHHRIGCFSGFQSCRYTSREAWGNEC